MPAAVLQRESPPAALPICGAELVATSARELGWPFCLI